MNVVACVFPTLRLTLAGLADRTAAVVSVREKKTELLGNMRLLEVSAGARALGIVPGDTIAHARAQCSGLEVVQTLERDVVSALERMCESLLPFAASVGYALTPLPTVFLDVTGCAHLFGGEKALLARVREGLIDCHRTAMHTALAYSARLAQMLACAGFSGVATAEHLHTLPVEALREVIGDRPVSVCVQLGLRTFADLQKLPKASLAHRLGSKAQDALALIWGVDRKPFTVYVPVQIPEESLELEDEVHTMEPLLFVLRPMLQALTERVRARGLGILTLSLTLETRPKTEALAVELPSLLCNVDDLWSVLKTRLERWSLPAPARALRLSAQSMGRPALHSETMFDAKPKGNFPRILAELVTELGEARVGKLDQVDTWDMGARSTLIRFQDKTARKGQLLPVEPMHYAQSEKCTPDRVNAIRHLLRLEHVAWWKQDASRAAGDLLLAWVDEKLCVVKKEAGRVSVLGVVD
jgi:protein ImuB